MTGRFEVTLFKGATNENGNGTLIFSGLSTGDFPESDWVSFFAKLEAAI